MFEKDVVNWGVLLKIFGYCEVVVLKELSLFEFWESKSIIDEINDGSLSLSIVNKKL